MLNIDGVINYSVDFDGTPYSYTLLFRMGKNSSYYDCGERNTVDRDILQLPEMVIDSFDINPEKILKESFDMIWNAFGFTHSFNYDKNGNWQGQR